MRATLKDLNSNSSALARAAQAGETVVITDRGTPIVDIVAHSENAWVTRAQLAAGLPVLQATLLNRTVDSETIRREMDEVVEPFVDLGVAG